MLKLRERYLVDENGMTTAVVLDIKTYRQLLRHLEDLEDAWDWMRRYELPKDFALSRAKVSTLGGENSWRKLSKKS